MTEKIERELRLASRVSKAKPHLVLSEEQEELLASATTDAAGEKLPP
jgi:hypothetical protein